MTTSANVRSRLRASRAGAEVLGTPGRIAGFLVGSGVVAFFYTLLLPFDYTQRFGLANWDYLSAYLLIWAIVLGLAMGLVVSIQVYAMRRIAAARAASGAAAGVAFVASLLPSFLCCTPIVPSVLAFVGVSGVGLYTTTGTLQHFFAVHQAEFLAASLALLVLMAWWGLRKVARASCLSEEGCELEGAPSAEMPSGEMPPGELSSGELSSGEMSPGEMSPGEMSPGEMAVSPHDCCSDLASRAPTRPSARQGALQ